MGDLSFRVSGAGIRCDAVRPAHIPRFRRLCPVTMSFHLAPFPAFSALRRSRAFFDRTFALAAAAFFARATRSAFVIVSRLRLPPILPPLRPVSLKNSKISIGSFGLSTGPAYAESPVKFLFTAKGHLVHNSIPMNPESATPKGENDEMASTIITETEEDAARLIDGLPKIDFPARRIGRANARFPRYERAAVRGKPRYRARALVPVPGSGVRQGGQEVISKWTNRKCGINYAVQVYLSRTAFARVSKGFAVCDAIA